MATSEAGRTATFGAIEGTEFPIDCKHVHYKYSTSISPSTIVDTCPYSTPLEDITFSLPPNSLVVIIGHNGSGKSTLLSLLGGKRKAMFHKRGEAESKEDSGRLHVLGRDAFSDMSLNRYVTLIGAPWPPEAVFGNTVDRVASPCADEARKKYLSDALHLPLKAQVDKMSSGEKRRVQILHGLLRSTNSIFLLDECSTDIDVAERATVMNLVKEECRRTNGACMYATHILDGVETWATHVLLMRQGKAMDFRPVTDLNGMTVQQYAHNFLAEKKWRPFKESIHAPSPSSPTGVASTVASEGALYENPGEPVIVCNNVSFRNVFDNLSFTVKRGQRVLLCGCNGCGKSTLLNMMGGKQFFNNSNKGLCILGKPCYDDMSLNALVSLGGDWWTSVPGGQVMVHEMVDMDTPRAKTLCKLLAINTNWDVRHTSDGERKRVQLLLHLKRDRPVVLLDEATADLDVDQRYELLRFLYAESVMRNVTVVYSTHIFDGLEGWASHAIILDRMKKGVHAMWGPEDANGEESIDLTRLANELIALKAKETF